MKFLEPIFHPNVYPVRIRSFDPPSPPVPLPSPLIAAPALTYAHAELVGSPHSREVDVLATCCWAGDLLWFTDGRDLYLDLAPARSRRPERGAPGGAVEPGPAGSDDRAQCHLAAERAQHLVAG